jgi:small subunit ribosomal protein S6
MANRVYEMMFIAEPDTPDDHIGKLNDAISKLIEDQGGSVVKVEDMGRRRLAYKIKKYTEGRYVLFEIEGSGKEIAELERRMRVNDTIFRYITVRVDEDRKAAEKMRAKREKRKATRRASRSNAAAEQAEAV